MGTRVTSVIPEEEQGLCKPQRPSLGSKVSSDAVERDKTGWWRRECRAGEPSPSDTQRKCPNPEDQRQTLPQEQADV